MPGPLSGREDTGVIRSDFASERDGGLVEELAEAGGSGSTIVIGTRRRLGGVLLVWGRGVDVTSIGFLFVFREDETEANT